MTPKTIVPTGVPERDSFGTGRTGRKEYRREDSFPSGGFEVSHNSFTRGFGTVGQVN
jgi:hypothetical protein